MPDKFSAGYASPVPHLVIVSRLRACRAVICGTAWHSASPLIPQQSWMCSCLRSRLAQTVFGLKQIDSNTVLTVAHLVNGVQAEGLQGHQLRYSLAKRFSADTTAVLEVQLPAESDRQTCRYVDTGSGTNRQIDMQIVNWTRTYQHAC